MSLFILFSITFSLILHFLISSNVALYLYICNDSLSLPFHTIVFHPIYVVIKRAWANAKKSKEAKNKVNFFAIYSEELERAMTKDREIRKRSKEDNNEHCKEK